MGQLGTILTPSPCRCCYLVLTLLYNLDLLINSDLPYFLCSSLCSSHVKEISCICHTFKDSRRTLQRLTWEIKEPTFESPCNAWPTGSESVQGLFTALTTATCFTVPTPFASGWGQVTTSGQCAGNGKGVGSLQTEVERPGSVLAGHSGSWHAAMF